jgi:hypothetical protein
MSTPIQPAAPEPTPEVFVPPGPPAEQFGLPRETPMFNLLDVGLVIVGGFFILVMVQAAAFAGAKMLPQFSALTIPQLAKLPLVIIPAQVVSYILLIGFVHGLMLARHGAGLLDAIPFRWPKQAAAPLLAAGVGLALAIQFLGRFMPIPKQLPIDEYFKERSAAFVMLAFAVFIAPVVEELLFRGLLYPVLNRLAGTIVSVAITSALFALLHASQLAFAWAPLLSLFLVGVALTLVRARYRSVMASTLMHMSYNATLFTFLLVATGGFRNMEVLSR